MIQSYKTIVFFLFWFLCCRYIFRILCREETLSFLFDMFFWYRIQVPFQMLSICLFLHRLNVPDPKSHEIPSSHSMVPGGPSDPDAEVMMIHPYFRDHLMTDSRPKVVLIGDSVVDHFAWLKDPSHHLRVTLENDAFKKPDGKQKEWICVNLAVADTSTSDFIERDPARSSWNWYQKLREKTFPLLTDQDHYYFHMTDGKMRQVANLRHLSHVKHVILSLGGNDLYPNLDMQQELIRGLSHHDDNLVRKIIQDFEARLTRCIEAVKESAHQADVTMVIPYHPHESFNVVGEQKQLSEPIGLSTIFQLLAQRILRVAQQQGCHVIDLSYTFDPKSEAHYGTGSRTTQPVNTLGVDWSGASPSNVSIFFIVALVQHVLKFTSDHKIHRDSYTFSGRDFEIKSTRITDQYIQDYKFGYGPRSIAPVARPVEGGGGSDSDGKQWEAWTGFVHQFLREYRGLAYHTVNKLQRRSGEVWKMAMIQLHAKFMGTGSAILTAITDYTLGRKDQKQTITNLIQFFIFLVARIPSVRRDLRLNGYLGVFYRGISEASGWKFDQMVPGTSISDNGLFSVSLSLNVASIFTRYWPSDVRGMIFILRPKEDVNRMIYTDLLIQGLELEVLFMPTITLTIVKTFIHPMTNGKFVVADMTQVLSVQHDPLENDPAMKKRLLEQKTHDFHDAQMSPPSEIPDYVLEALNL